MKKILTLIMALMLSVACVFGLVACDDGSSSGGGDEGGSGNGNPPVVYSLYAPDGAPALSVARLLADKTIISEIDVNVVSASTIQTFVTGANPTADFCIMPVNAASKLLGSGSTYQMLGAVTNGNLFLMKKTSNASNVNVESVSDLNNLVGKKVGVLNLANVPGLTFKAILADNGISYQDLAESGSVDSAKVNLVGLSGGTQVVPSADYDYYVVAEPAATTKQNATNGALSIAGSLQQLYGAGNGFPQAVLVAKKSVISANSALITKLINSFAQNKAWLTASTTTMQSIVNAVVSGFVDSNMSPTFTANNLNANVIANCSISFRSAVECKQDVLTYIAKLNTIVNNWGTPQNAFFYGAN